MFVVTLSEEQMKFVLNLMDLELKRGGLNVLPSVVDLHNALAAAQDMGVKREGENAKEDLPGSGT